MHFDRYGRTYHLRLRTDEDLKSALDLDDSLWIATSAPVSCLRCDADFLRLVDIDKNNRIRTDEVRTAIRWLLERLSDRSGLATETDELPLSALDVSGPAGQRLLNTARYILSALGADDAETINLKQIGAFEKGLDDRTINGDGVIPPAATDDDEVRQFIVDVMECFGSQEDLTGEMGITEENLERFLHEATAYLNWLAQADIPEGQGSTEIMPLGEEMPGAYQAFDAIREKVDGFFTLCKLMRFNPQATDSIGISAYHIEQAELGQPGAAQAVLARAPLAEPNDEGLLPLRGPVNPYYAEALRELKEAVVERLVGEGVEQLSESQWNSVKATFDPYRNWLAGKRGPDVEKPGREKLRRYLEGHYADAVRALLAADREVAARLADARELKKLLLYHQHLLRLANNFVSFPDLYDPTRRAMFEMGSLVIDGRWFNFAVKVEDVREHSKRAKRSGMLVMYCELRRADEKDVTMVAVPATAGTIGNLCVGKRGVFFDTLGQHYDACVIEIIENPISFREALVAPFVKLGRFIGGKIEAISGSAEKEVEAQLGQATQQVQAGIQETVREAPRLARQAEQAPVQSAASASASRRDILLGASVSIAALSSAFAFITKTLAGVERADIITAVIVGAVVVVVPTAVVAGFKLARRDLSSILEGCGWAINVRMRLNRAQRKQFTRHEPYPADATGTPPRRWVVYVLLLLLAVALAVGAVRAWRAWVGPRWGPRVEQPAAAPSAAGRQPPAPEEPPSGPPEQ